MTLNLTARWTLDSVLAASSRDDYSIRLRMQNRRNPRIALRRKAPRSVFLRH